MAGAVIRLNGVVQGVGFRPFVYRLAKKYQLKGKVYNSSGGVVIEVQGPKEDIEAFYRSIPEEKPPLAQILQSKLEWAEVGGYDDFTIDTSVGEQETTVLVTPDVGICPDCQRELFDPEDKRYRYPFINCTNCGPRFTIVKNLPYDRPYTTMAPFIMCPSCQGEYDDPLDRRFHAQPNACPRCGPWVWLDEGPEAPEKRPDPDEVFRQARAKIRQGQILAVKGLGGFHLICDATNEEAVAALRKRKRRPAKPFAVMFKDLAKVKDYCRVSEEEEELLTSWRKPIVLLDVLPGGKRLAPSVAPGLDKLGVMLAYTPLHLLLFEDGIECLVATSANFSDYPLVTDNAVAWEKLRPIVDSYLFHNREIFNRCDDSVVKVDDGEFRPIRRARGYAPQPLNFRLSAGRTLAFGGDEKNTFCLSRGRSYFVSQHIGEINNLESVSFLEKAISRFEHYFQVNPGLVVHDLHPEYRSTKIAKKWAQERGLPTVAVQHHEAHLAACLLEYDCTDPVLGVVCDGTGYGSDGKLWGFEIFTGALPNFRRIGHLSYTPLPGGEIAIKEPWRMAFSHLYTHLGPAWAREFAAEQGRPANQAKLVERQLELGLNSPETSSAGRFFDAVSAFLGIGTQGTYEGQPAIELEVAAKGSGLAGKWNEGLAFDVKRQEGSYIIDPVATWRDLWERQSAGEDPRDLAARFHHTIAAIITSIVEQAASEYDLDTVALSGGVFQNSYLSTYLPKHLAAKGFKVLFPRLLPVNDGGISVGQAVLGHLLTEGGYNNVSSYSSQSN
ncbi:MAG: carbamoyltransferase HypF [Firmicutes bacterium]|nr:carbamoyltransferase HypF [Bacillota bacterium]